MCSLTRPAERTSRHNQQILCKPRETNFFKTLVTARWHRRVSRLLETRQAMLDRSPNRRPDRPGSGFVYDAASAVAFRSRAGKRFLMRSALKARWALVFDQIGLSWTYEPRTFDLPLGRAYTPDFYIEGVGFVEVKPTLEALIDVQSKLAVFARSVSGLVRAGRAPRLFSLAVSAPSLQDARQRRGSLVEWRADGRFDVFAPVLAARLLRPAPLGELHDRRWCDVVEAACHRATEAEVGEAFTMAEAMSLAAGGLLAAEKLASRVRR